MKRLLFLLSMFCIYSVHASKSIEEIYENIPQAAIEYGQDEDDPLFMYQYLQNELVDVDVECLKNDPEILYIKVLAGFESSIYIQDIQDFKDHIMSLKKDLRFIMDYAPYNSRLFAAAQLRMELINKFQNISILSDIELLKAYQEFTEFNLRKFIGDIDFSGKELREQVLEKIKSSEEMKHAFLDFIILCDEDISIVQNRCTIKNFEILDLEYDEDMGWGISFHLELNQPGVFYEIIGLI
ncbi:MAG: hypothetical protein FJZ57_03705 [Chlamydiae bacterium]|nr:hypothetical protein [Chlamydiota bacterium]